MVRDFDMAREVELKSTTARLPRRPLVPLRPYPGGRRSLFRATFSRTPDRIR
jgi:hypothetical protein